MIGDRRAPVLSVARQCLCRRLAAEILADGSEFHLRGDDPGAGIGQLRDRTAVLCAQRRMAHRELGHQALARDEAVVLGTNATAGMALGIAARRDPARAQTFEAPIDGDIRLRIGIGPGTVVDRDGRLSRGRMQVDFAHRHADFGMQRSGVPDAPGCGQRPGGDAGSDIFPGSVMSHGAEPPRLKQKRPSSPYRMEIGRLERRS